MKKIKLKQESTFPASLIGISSQHHDFQVAWSINKALQKKLTKTKSISVRLKSGEKSNVYNFSVFSYSDLDGNNFSLISNKEEGATLYTKYKNIDFFFIVKSNEISIDNVLLKISGKEFIIGSFIITTNNVFNKIIERVLEN